MTPGILCKKIWSYLLSKSGYFHRKIEALDSNSNLILTYHHVIPEAEVPKHMEPGMFVTPNSLRNQIRLLKKHFSISHISILSNGQRINHDILKKTGKPKCILTFDDGWLDFYTHAWPIIKDEEVPAVVFLPTSFIGTKKVFWTDRLMKILSDGGQQHIDRLLYSRKFNLSTRTTFNFQKNYLKCIEKLKNYSCEEIDRILTNAEKKTKRTTKSRRSFMDWKEVRELFASGLVSFGSHTNNHEILTNISHNKIKDEINQSNTKLLSEIMNITDISFCYPNGNYSNEIVSIVKEHLFSLAVTCDPGINKHGSDLYTLKRISLHEDICSSSNLFYYHLVKYFN